MTEQHHRARTNDEGQILLFASTSLVLDGREPLCNEILSLVGGLFVDDHLSKHVCVSYGLALEICHDGPGS